MTELTLEVRRTVAAPPARVFAAWTDPALLVRWWGPPGVACPEAHVDLRVGGAWSIANDTPGGTVWLRGTFEVIEAPERLVYTWSVDGSPAAAERVTVRFEPVGTSTEVVVVHEKIVGEATKAEHAVGWGGCLSGLERLLGGTGL